MNKLLKNSKMIALLVGLAMASFAYGQEQSPRFTLEGYGLYDLHLATGSVGGGALALTYHVNPHYDLAVGAEGVSSERYALNLAGSATLWNASKGSLVLENRYLYRQFATLNVQEFTGALQLKWKADHVKLALGLCNRYQAELVQRNNGGEATILEPMNVMFAVEGWLSPNCNGREWNVGARWSNYNDYVIERVANWRYSLKGYVELKDNTFFTAEVGIHPVGSLNLTSSYDGWFMHLGARRDLAGRRQK